MLESLFKFPVVMVDGNKEEEKERRNLALALQEDNEVDIIIGEAECPYHDFVCIADRWLPTDESFQRALDKKFDACYVVFLNSGGYVVPWSKEKFKRELKKFITNIKPQDEDPGFQVIRLTKEQLMEGLRKNEEE